MRPVYDKAIVRNKQTKHNKNKMKKWMEISINLPDIITFLVEQNLSFKVHREEKCFGASTD